MSTYQVTNVGNMWHIVDLSKNKTVAFRESYEAAVEFAEDKEFQDKLNLSLFVMDQEESRKVA